MFADSPLSSDNFLATDDNDLALLKWLEKLDGELSIAGVEEKKAEQPDWDWEEMDRQLYSMMMAAAVPKSTSATK